MEIINIDDLVDEAEEQKIKVKGKTYVIPNLGYGPMMELSKISKGIGDAIKEDDAASAMEGNVTFINFVIKELSPEVIRELSSGHIRQIIRVINAHYMEGGMTALEKELNFYRKKYEDEYRKNLSEAGENG